MYIYISKFMSDEKIENLKIFDREFKNFGIELYFSTKKLAQYKVNAIDIFFLDYELNTTMDFIDEYEMLLSANKKIIFLTDMLSPLNEFELTTMINMEAEFFYKELRRVFQKNGNSKVKTPFMDKRWKYQDIQNLTYLKNHVRLSSWPFNRLQFLDAKQGDFFTNAQYVTMQKLIELYILIIIT